MIANKQTVQNFWEQASCGEDLYLADQSRDSYREQARHRYELEPYIAPFAAFDMVRGQRVLEIGVGLGADHQRYAEGGAILTGIDLTERAIEHTRKRFALFELKSELSRGDAENLPFPADSFDQVYSWGVLHHSPDTPKTIREVHKVLADGGVARIMIYHTNSLVGYMLWLRYALARFKPWMSLAEVYAEFLESPGTKAYSVDEARQLFSAYKTVRIETVLTHGDLLESGAGQRHGGIALAIARQLWPRWLLRRIARNHGLFMLVTATK